MPRLTFPVLLAVGLLGMSCAVSGEPGRPPGPRTATTFKGNLAFVLRDRRLTLAYNGPRKRSSAGYALLHNRVSYACSTSVWAGLGQEEPRGSGLATARDTRPLPRRTRRKTVLLDRDISADVGACVLRSIRPGSRVDVAVARFIPTVEYVRRDAPGPPHLSPRSGERSLETSLFGTQGVGLFLAERSLRIVISDEAPLSIQRDFRTQLLRVLCVGSRELGTRASADVRFPPRSREVVARFPVAIPPDADLTCGVETGLTGTEAYGSIEEGS